MLKRTTYNESIVVLNIYEPNASTSKNKTYKIEK